MFELVEGLEVLDGVDQMGESISEDEDEQEELERIVRGEGGCELIEGSDDSSEESSDSSSPSKRQKL